MCAGIYARRVSGLRHTTAVLPEFQGKQIGTQLVSQASAPFGEGLLDDAEEVIVRIPHVLLPRMSKLIYITNTSLDSYVEDETGAFDWVNPDQVHAFITELLRPIGTHLYGRRLYETMAYCIRRARSYRERALPLGRSG